MATLWLVVGVAAVVLTMNTAATHLALGSRNRANSRRTYWRALGCLAHARSRADEALDHADRPQEVWESLSQVIVADEDSDCRIEAIATGMTIDVNHASALALRITAEHAGLRPDQADSVVRVLGPPRVRPFLSVEELREAGGGMLGRFGISTLFGVDSETVNLSRSPPAVIAGALTDDATHLAPAGSPGLGSAHPTMMTSATSAWWLSARATFGEPPSTSTVALRLVLIGRRVAIQEVRTW